MVVHGAVAKFLVNIAQNKRPVGCFKGDDAVLFLALKYEFDSPIDSLAIYAVARTMAVCHKRQNAQAGNAWLAEFQRGK